MIASTIFTLEHKQKSGRSRPATYIQISSIPVHFLLVSPPPDPGSSSSGVPTWKLLPRLPSGASHLCGQLFPGGKHLHLRVLIGPDESTRCCKVPTT
ncbi:hypothetical protein QR680_009097 [Steinernema hermaphroditum]|uniref:Uncharacterized protein n=1 Tax=Steinernema hermaphroditum TaxID=289476 RepID=A0AA39IKC7_9BILA|nr:hypothetical protein QR680_009097 [Steinernema hermaphroditum]